MPIGDAERWNQRYQTDQRYSFEQPRKLLLDHVNLLPSRGLALDIAMGLGGNAHFLLERGLRVVGVDVSHVAVRKTKISFPQLMTVIADLNLFYIPKNTFDLIIDFFYLQQSLWLPMTNGLKEGGMLFIECLLEGMRAIHPEINPQYLLKPGELKENFIKGELGEKMKILEYREGWCETGRSHPRLTASIIARRATQ